MCLCVSRPTSSNMSGVQTRDDRTRSPQASELLWGNWSGASPLRKLRSGEFPEWGNSGAKIFCSHLSGAARLYLLWLMCMSMTGKLATACSGFMLYQTHAPFSDLPRRLRGQRRRVPKSAPHRAPAPHSGWPCLPRPATTWRLSFPAGWRLAACSAHVVDWTWHSLTSVLFTSAAKKPAMEILARVACFLALHIASIE